MKDFIKSNYLLFIKIILTIYALYSLKYLFSLKNLDSEFYMNITFIFITAAVYFLINYTINTFQHGIDRRLLIISLFMGLYFAFVAVLGAYYEGSTVGVHYKITIANFTLNDFMNSLKYIPVFIFLFMGCIIFIFKQIPYSYNNYIQSHGVYTVLPDFLNSLYKIWFFIFICWLPYFILLYPGLLSTDAVGQINQFITGKYSSHHTLLTTIFYYFIYFYYNISNNGLLSIALFIFLFQIIPFSFSFAYMLYKLKNVFNISNGVVLMLLLFIALHPANAVTAISLEKSLYFFIFFNFFLVELIVLVYNTDLLKSKKYIIRFIIIGSVLCLTRNNVLHALIFLLPFMLYFAKEYRKSIIFIFCSIFISYIAINTSLIEMMDVEKGDKREALSVPMQQLARVYVYNNDTLSDDDLKYIQNIINKDISKAYMPLLSDPIKSGFNNDLFLNKESIAYYFKLGLKYPNTYLNSHLIMTERLWYPFSNQFWSRGFTIDHISFKSLNITHKDFLADKNKTLHKWLTKTHLLVKQNNSMFMFTMVNQSIFFYILIMSIMYLIYRKSYKNVLVLLLPLGYTLTIFFAPIMYIRYTYYLIAIFPLIIMMLINNRDNEIV